jgi:hypothetical protein
VYKYIHSCRKEENVGLTPFSLGDISWGIHTYLSIFVPVAHLEHRASVFHFSFLILDSG